MAKRTKTIAKEMFEKCVNICEALSDDISLSTYTVYNQGLVDGLEMAAKIMGYELEAHVDMESEHFCYTHVTLAKDGEEICSAPVKAPEREVTKEQFMDTDCGKEIKECISGWDFAMDMFAKSEPASDERLKAGRKAIVAEKRFNGYKEYLSKLFNAKYEYVRGKDYYGVATLDHSDWLFRETVNRDQR